MKKKKKRNTIERKNGHEREKNKAKESPISNKNF